ncbi:hypothetical protein [Chitinophaga solisilvae]|uniref:hypothetical protein n=1 Tax=Chitinophaga solisilvae TaxID=1233460 RepID=UPI00136A7B09|nr:hypothetical protein [Chitinophaga solisilvae]
MKQLTISGSAIRKLHYISGITLSLFISIHLLNHLFALAGPTAHIALMEKLRKVYRHPVIETILLLAVLTQVVSGIRLLFNRQRKLMAESIQIYSGMYLSFFLIVHVSAVIAGRLMAHLDTNFYFSGAGLNLYPVNLFFIPYYFLSVCAISLHIASLHYLKTKSGWSAGLIGAAGLTAALLIIVAHTNNFKWWEIPFEYRAFIEKYSGKG